MVSNFYLSFRFSRRFFSSSFNLLLRTISSAERSSYNPKICCLKSLCLSGMRNGSSYKIKSGKVFTKGRFDIVLLCLCPYHSYLRAAYYFRRFYSWPHNKIDNYRVVRTLYTNCTRQHCSVPCAHARYPYMCRKLKDAMENWAV